MKEKEFAQAVADRISGAKVVEAEKLNGVKKIGIALDLGTNMSPTIYVDEFIKHGMSVDETVRHIQENVDNYKVNSFDVSILHDFEKVRPLLRVMLVNQSTRTDCCISAKEFGFPDLLLIPVINIKFESGYGRIRLTMAHIESWGKSLDYVLNEGIKNLDCNIVTLESMMEKRFGVSVPPNNDMSMFVVTNKEFCGGASSIIVAMERLTHIFPEGYIVIPSSVHEVLVVSAKLHYKIDNLTQLVKDVNSEVVAPDEVLGTSVYEFMATA